MKKPTKSVAEVLNAIDNNEFKKEDLVSILILTSHVLDVQTVSQRLITERKKKNGIKTARGIRISKRIRKEVIGGKTFTIDGLTDNNHLPF